MPTQRTDRLLALTLSLAALASLASGQVVDPDTDGDGLSDFQERHKYGTNPSQSDSDGDGTPDGDWNERREYAYTVRTVVRVLRPVDVAAANDDYQDARLREETDEWLELEVIHYPLGTAGEAVGADPDWRDAARELKDYLKSTTTSNFDGAMRKTLLAELRESGVDPKKVDDRKLVVAAAERLMSRAAFEDGFTTFLADFKGRTAVIPRELEKHAREEAAKAGRSIKEQQERELFAQGMFENRVHGSCTSSAIYLCGGLRAVGIPTRIVLVIPLVDANDPEQLALMENGIRHHRVRQIALKGIRPLRGSWASHTFNEVFVGGRWRRLNYTRLGQPILDENLYGLTTHVLTVRDWSEARMGLTVGRRQGLALRDEVFRTANPYATLEVSDQFGIHATIPNPEIEEPKAIDEVTIERAFWVASEERPQHLDISGVDMQKDRQHVVLAARTDGLPLEGEPLNLFFRSVAKGFELVPMTGEPVPARAIRGSWFGRVGPEPYLYFLLKIGDEERERLIPGAAYVLRPVTTDGGPCFRAAEGLSIVVPG